MQKTVSMLRGIFQASFQNINPQWSVSTDYENSWPNAPAAVANPSGTSLWGTGIWGTMIWGGSTSRYRFAEWETVEGVGQSISWQLQVTLGNTESPDIELAAIDILHEIGDAVA